MKKYNYGELENVMLNIVSEGQEKVWKEIEKEKDAIKRCEKRKLYAHAVKKIKRGK